MAVKFELQDNVQSVFKNVPFASLYKLTMNLMLYTHIIDIHLHAET